MARTYGNIATAIWLDDDFQRLTIDGQHTYLLLATQPNISAAGVLPMTLGRWSSRAADSNIDRFEGALDELVQLHFIHIDRGSEELLVRSFVKWDGGFGNPKRKPVIIRAGREVQSPMLRRVLAIEFEKLGLPIDGLPASHPEIDGGSAVEIKVGKRDPSSESAFPQGNSLSPCLSASDGVVVTKALVLRPQPTTRTPQTTTPAAVAVAEAPPTSHAGTPEIISSTPLNGPSVPAQRWAESDRKPTTPNAVFGRTAALFPKPKPVAVETLPEAHQVIYAWLQTNGFRSLGIDEVRQIHQQLIIRYGSKLNIGYLRSVVSGDGVRPYATPFKDARNKEISDAVKEIRETFPQCPHDVPAGNQPHPTTGILLCAHCQRGIPAQPVEDATKPEVQAAIDAYRARRGNSIYFAELLNTTQQIEAFLAEGATPEQVIALAEVAGEQRISLIQAAGVAA
jgi:hypothetical protein